MSSRLEYFFDYVSPFSFLANTQLAGLAERTGAEIVYRPFFLGGVMKATGNKPPISVPAKGAYMGSDIQRWCNLYDVEVQPNPHFPVLTVTAILSAFQRWLTLDPLMDGCGRRLRARQWCRRLLRDLELAGPRVNQAPSARPRSTARSRAETCTRLPQPPERRLRAASDLRFGSP